MGEGSDFALEVFSCDENARVIIFGTRLIGGNLYNSYRLICVVDAFIRDCRRSGHSVQPQEFLAHAFGLPLVFTVSHNYLRWELITNGSPWAHALYGVEGKHQWRQGM